MKKKALTSLSILLTIIIVITIPVIWLLNPSTDKKDAWANVPKKLPQTNHADLLKGPFKDGPSVTRACLECHPDAGDQVIHSAHFTWESPAIKLPGRDEPVVLGKKHAMNNFCIGITSNWPPCTACHTGYGWEDDSFDFTNQELIDCLVCHDHSGQYVKSKGGYPAPDVDLVAVAKSVGPTTRDNCGGCHFRGGGGNAVKHGDLDESLYNPSENIDIHMGKHNFLCTDCHQTENHNIRGRSISVSADNENQVYCTDCHDQKTHKDERINTHTASVACQTCHIPHAAVKEATKMHWDWSEAGKDLPENPHEYLKIKGRFVYEKNIQPDYFWFNGNAKHYVMGDKIDPTQPTLMNEPDGSIKDPNAKIWPFKLHTAKQIYDPVNNYLLVPKTFGKGGFWTEFDWQKAAELGSEATGLDYSGQFGFTNTVMFWPITHMVASKDKALQCIDCHGESENTRMNWSALGYDGDPMLTGGRKNKNL